MEKSNSPTKEGYNTLFVIVLILGICIIYGIAKEGIAKYEESDNNDNIYPLLDSIIETTSPFEGNENDPLQLQISSLDYDDYIGRLGIGRVNKGKIKTGQMVTI